MNEFSRSPDGAFSPDERSEEGTPTVIDGVPSSRYALLRTLLLLILIIVLLIFMRGNFTFPQQLPAQNILTTGIIASIPEQANHSTQFIFIPDNTNTKIFLRWYYPPPVNLKIGDQWMLRIDLKPAWQNWLLTQNINGLGTVKFDYKNQIILPKKTTFPLQKIRENIYTSIKKTLHNKPGLGFISALTIGMRDQITQTQWDDLRGTGTNHLMAIAGLHIGFLFGFIFYLANKLWRLSKKLMLFLPAQEAGLASGFIGALSYAALSGFAIPAKRAVIMLGVFVFFKLSRRKINISTSYFMAVFLVLLIQPLSLWTPTFWLSFTAVALLIYGNGGRVGEPGLFWHWTRAQWVMAIGLIPLNLLFFQQISWVGFLANLIAIPYIGFIILPLCLIGIIIHPVWKLAEFLLMEFWQLMHMLAKIPHSQYYHVIDMKLILPSFIGVMLLLAPKEFPARWLGFCWLLPLFFGH
ncbi:MAG TPA: ComEC/Rec2 family competence protein [Gammaproteobacteria bacterium]|nr:ComEC/Rec2 family competence protein [Gammaproteobacteria bacterium]